MADELEKQSVREKERTKHQKPIYNIFTHHVGEYSRSGGSYIFHSCLSMICVTLFMGFTVLHRKGHAGSADCMHECVQWKMLPDKEWKKMQNYYRRMSNLEKKMFQNNLWEVLSNLSLNSLHREYEWSNNVLNCVRGNGFFLLHPTRFECAKTNASISITSVTSNVFGNLFRTTDARSTRNSNYRKSPSVSRSAQSAQRKWKTLFYLFNFTKLP